MKLEEIKRAVDAGVTIHWKNEGYRVICDDHGQYLVCHDSGSCVGLVDVHGDLVCSEGDYFPGDWDVESLLQSYLTCALWSSSDDSDDSLFDTYGIGDIAEEAINSARSDVKSFLSKACVLLLDSGLSEDSIGHDFWLTRCGHGAGFWARGLGDVGDALTAICEEFGNLDPYVGDDGFIYIS